VCEIATYLIEFACAIFFVPYNKWYLNSACLFSLIVLTISSDAFFHVTFASTHVWSTHSFSAINERQRAILEELAKEEINEGNSSSFEGNWYAHSLSSWYTVLVLVAYCPRKYLMIPWLFGLG